MERIDAYQRRAKDVTVDIATDLDPGDLTDIGFRVADLISKTGLTAEEGGSGLTVDLTLTADDLDITPDTYPYECFATVEGEVRTVAEDYLVLGPEPTAEESP